MYVQGVSSLRLNLAHDTNTDNKKARSNPRFGLNLLCILRVNIVPERRIP